MNHLLWSNYCSLVTHSQWRHHTQNKKQEEVVVRIPCPPNRLDRPMLHPYMQRIYTVVKVDVLIRMNDAVTKVLLNAAAVYRYGTVS